MFNLLDFDPSDKEALATYAALKQANDEQNAKQAALQEKIDALLETPSSRKLKGEITTLQEEVRQAYEVTQEKVREHIARIQPEVGKDEDRD